MQECSTGASPDRYSILSELSEDEDVPASDSLTLNIFLQRAMNGMQEVVKRGRIAAEKGIRAVYAVKLGQQQSKRTEYYHKQKKREAEEEGR